MSGPFARRARHALRDQQLHVALDRTTAQLGLRRATGLASLEQADAVRDRARAAKMALLHSLADSLRAFEARLVENGARVHWAETTADANRIIV